MTDSIQTQEKEPNVTVTLSLSKINIVLAGLSELPHKISRDVIDEIAEQAKAQLQKT